MIWINLIFKVTDLKEEYYRIDSLCRAKKDNVDRLILEENRLATKLYELQNGIKDAVDNENSSITPLLE